MDVGYALRICGYQGWPVLDRSLPPGGVPPQIWSSPLPPLQGVWGPRYVSPRAFGLIPLGFPL